ncbi:hypothetical protein ATJ97_0072 [Georgenia soli]|uniref:TrbL/VirB6 plasmid conjugal transfer protein n=1 Tax=Georgenia soli TaxID=638953 RepID=A0A2A9F3S0_9MICO|nr:hypothetical protein [Georgenia soli]PFG45150.1 hypothetical protein ATJ97_0072 [Georgenia soli]
MATEKNCGFDVLCHTGRAASSVVSDATDNLADQVMEAFASVIASLGTLWVNVGTPNLTNTGGTASVDGASAPGISELMTVLGYVTWVSLAVAIVALMILGALIATRIRMGEGLASLGKVGLILGGVALVGGAGSIVSALLPNGPVGVSGTVEFLQSSLWPYMLIAAALSVVVGGARMFWESRAEPGRDLLRSLLTLAVVGGAGVTVVALLVTAADRFSVWVINNSLACDVTAADGACFKENVGELLGLTAAAGGAPGQGVPLSAVLVIIFGLIAILASLVQIVLMVARSGMLVILAGILPLAASFTNTEMGRSWFRKCIGWLVAFILYKPAAAVVYAAAFQLTGTDVFGDDGSGILAVVTGLMLMVLALVAMPALMRFVTPMVSSLAAGGGGAAVAAGTMAAIPTGAAAVGRLATGAGGGGAAMASNAAPQSSSHNTNSTTSSTTSPSGAGQGGSKGGAPAPTGAPAAGGGQAASAGSGTATGATAGGSAAAGGAAATGAGAAAGPAGAAVAAGLQAGQAASSAARKAADQVTGDGPSGSN